MAYGQANVDTIQSSTAGTPPVFKDGNSNQIGTLCRAWVNFASGSSPVINASFNVSSVTYIGVGQFRITMTNAMPDANYSAVFSGKWLSAAATIFTEDSAFTRTTTQVQASGFSTAGGYANPTTISAAIFR